MGKLKGKRSVELISLPFDDVENAWFDEHLKDGKGKRLPGASDTIIMRGLAKGDPTFLEKAKNLPGRKVDGVNWETFRESLHHGSGAETESMDMLMSNL